MTETPKISDLARRERQIMEVIYQLESATAADIVEKLPDKPKNATVRTILSVLEEKGFLRHETVKGTFIYYPTIPLNQARKSALNQVLDTFFKGAEANAVISILKESESKLSQDDVALILELIDESRKEGR